VTLAGFHALNLGMFELAREYSQTGKAAYSKLQEREFERSHEGYSVIKHRAFVGTGYFDEMPTASRQALRPPWRSRVPRKKRSSISARPNPVRHTPFTSERSAW
jgi:Isocitrate lyase family